MYRALTILSRLSPTSLNPNVWEFLALLMGDANVCISRRLFIFGGIHPMTDGRQIKNLGFNCVLIIYESSCFTITWATILLLL